MTDLVLFSSVQRGVASVGRGLGSQGGPQIVELGPEWLGVDYFLGWLVFNQGSVHRVRCSQ